MRDRILRLSLKALNVALWFRAGRWAVTKLLLVLIAVALAPLSRFIAALMSPLFRSFPLSREAVGQLFTHVATLYKDEVPVYAAGDGYTATEIQEMAIALAELFITLRTHYKLELDDAALAKLLDAVAVRLVEATQL